MTEIKNNQKYDLEERTAKFGGNTRGSTWIPASAGMTTFFISPSKVGFPGLYFVFCVLCSNP